jgi:cell wall-associated NlpC family hydrolase
VSERSYFDDPLKAQLFAQEATSWIGAPFSEYHQDKREEAFAQLKALGITPPKSGRPGIDCVGLVQEIFSGVGATGKWFFPRTSADYQSHQTGEKVLDWLRGKVDDPQSKKLGEILLELKIPDAVTDPDADTPRDFFKVGDILVMRHGGLFHMPVIIDDDLHIVSAIPRKGVVEGTIQDSSYSLHLVAVFRLKP